MSACIGSLPSSGELHMHSSPSSSRTACRLLSDDEQHAMERSHTVNLTLSQVLEVGLVRQRLEDAPPDPLLAPPTETAEDAVPFAERLRQVAPRRARAHDPQDAFHEHPVVAPRP